VEQSAEAVFKHMADHLASAEKPGQNIACDTLLSKFVSSIDGGITTWDSYPAELIRAAAESESDKRCFAGSQAELAKDMLMIRIQCAEEFQRVAKEYAELLRLRLESGKGKED